MPIGDSFTLPIPSVGDSGTGYAVKVNAILTELIARVSADVPFSALSGTTLDMDNVPVVDARYVGLYEQVSSPGASPVGRLENYQGNLYWVNTSGAVRITLGATLDFSVAGSIGGDYGGANPALVTFDDAAERYEFYDNSTTNTWAFIRARGLDIANDTAGTEYVQVRYGGAGSYTLNLPETLPSAGRAVLVLDNTGNLAMNDGTNTITNDMVLGGTTKIKHGSRTVHCGALSGLTISGSISTALEYPVVGVGPWVYLVPIRPENGHKITSVTARITRSATAGTASVVLRKNSAASMTDVGSPATSAATSSTITLTQSGLTEVVADLTTYLIKLTLPAANDILIEIQYTYQVD